MVLCLHVVIILFLLSSHEHISLLGLIATGPFSSPFSSKGLRQVSVYCCHLVCLLPFAWEDPHSLFLVCCGISVPRTQLWFPNYFFHEVKYFYYGLIDSSSVEGKSSFCQLLSSLICFGKCFWLGE